MKITVETYDNKYTIEEPHDDQDIYEMMGVLERMLFAMGYNPDSVKEGFIDIADAYKEDENEL